MLGALRDPLWQFVGALLAFIAILMSIVIYYKQRTKKIFSYEIISRTPLLSIEDEIKGDLLILYKENPIEQVYLIVIKFINSGNTPILSSDFECPISLRLDDDVQIFSVEIIETVPDSLNFTYTIEDKIIIINPTLLNNGDSFKFKILVNKNSEIKVDGRIVGVKDITKYSESSIFFYILSMFGSILALYGLASLLVINIELLRWKTLFIFIVGYSLMLISLIFDTKTRKRLSQFIKTFYKK